MADKDELVLVARHGAVVVVTLNRPAAMNALSAALRRELAAVFRALGDDAGVRALVLTGAGERAFCAGLDLKELGAASVGLGDATAQDPQTNPVAALYSCGKPVVGAVNGVAITGGLELALACDILVASDTARFADTHARVGILPGWGASQELSRRIGLPRALEMSLTGNFIAAQQAADWGLVNRVVPAADLLAVAVRLAQDIAGVDPEVAGRYRCLIREGYGMAMEQALMHELATSRPFNVRLGAGEVEQRRAEVLARGRSQPG